MSRFNWAPSAYRLLNGVFCVYKPELAPVHKVVESIKLKLCKDLNSLPCYKHEIVMGSPITENLKEKSLSLDIEPKGIEDWSEHRLVLGDRYDESDFRIHFVDGLSKHSTGVLVLGIGKFGRDSVEMIAMSKFLRVYHVKGRLGWATHNFSPKGRILQRTSFKHVSKVKLDKVCAAAQAAYTRQMYSLNGINPDSQEAYEMASSGLIRPADRKTGPILYGIKCVDFQPPDFTLEIHSINESCPFFREFIHNLAIKLKTTAVCTGIRRLRYGTFDLSRALLRQHWHLDSIIDNIMSNNDLLTPEKLFIGAHAEHVEIPPPTKQLLIGDEEYTNGLGIPDDDKRDLILSNGATDTQNLLERNNDNQDKDFKRPP
ncbi:Mitochondrial mRNA pseudouridine synthase Trub2 [Bulinus truncatus]|nr:Mitochondrial mRNA pseudouridine synthase Trub2 [Bulinus truncatus]